MNVYKCKTQRETFLGLHIVGLLKLLFTHSKRFDTPEGRVLLPEDVLE